VASIEGRLSPESAIVRSPDRLKDIDSAHWREVDASIRFQAGSADILITIECRRRGAKDDVTWIEQLATKREKVGASKTIAVSARGFSQPAVDCAGRYGIELRTLKPITGNEVDQWLGSDNFVHYYRSVTDFHCDVETETGRSVSFEGMEPRFREPNVHGLFPAAAFLEFIEMKNPEVFLSISLDGVPVPVDLNFKGADPNLVPVPLGKPRKPGLLTVEISSEDHPVKSVRMRLQLAHVSRRLDASGGQHFAYGAPGEARHVLSTYTTDMFKMPVEIERHSGKYTDRVASTLRFPNGLELQATTIDPRLYDVEAINVERLAMKPITIKLRNGEFAQGVFLAPLREFFSDENERMRIAQEAFLFVARADLEWIQEQKKLTPNARMRKHILQLIPKKTVEYVDISAALGAK
jgi:hypothetical protein